MKVEGLRFGNKNKSLEIFLGQCKTESGGQYFAGDKFIAGIISVQDTFKDTNASLIANYHHIQTEESANHLLIIVTGVLSCIALKNLLIFKE